MNFWLRFGKVSGGLRRGGGRGGSCVSFPSPEGSSSESSLAGARKGTSSKRSGNSAARRRDGSRSRHAIGVQQAGKGAPALGCDDHALLLVRWLRLGSVCGRRFAAGPRASSLPPRKGLEQISRRITFRSAGRSAHRSRPWRPLHRRPWSRSRPRATRGTPTALLRATRLRHGALTLASARAAQVAPDWLNGAHHRRAETGANFCVTTFGRYKFQ